VAKLSLRHLGAIQRVHAALDAAQKADFRRGLRQFWDDNNRARDGTTRVDSEYLEVVAIRA
jgi:hypothetical protein